MSKLRLVELFAGIGAQAKALENLGIEFESIVCEIDKNAYKGYCAIHGDTPNLGDITKVEKLPDCDIVTWSFPCQSLSTAGLKEGMAEGSGTKSSLGWEVIRLLKATENKPKYLIMENVPAILHQTNKPEFDKICNSLSLLGYANSYKVLNAKDYGIAQNRERCFMISVLGKQEFIFPDGEPLYKRLKDYLEPEVDECFYLKQHQIENYERYKTVRERQIYLQNGDLHLNGWHKDEQIVYNNNNNSVAPTMKVGGTPHKVEDLQPAGDMNYDKWIKCEQFVYNNNNNNNMAGTITAHAGKGQPPKVEESYKGHLHKDGWYEQSQRVCNPDGESDTIVTQGNTNRVKVEEFVKAGELNKPEWFKQRQTVTHPDNLSSTIVCKSTDEPKVEVDMRKIGTLNRAYIQENWVYDKDGLAPTTTTQSNITIAKIEEKYCGKLNYTTYNQADKVISQHGVSPTITACNEGICFPKTEEQTTKHQGGVIERDGQLIRIRYLTPLECLRLMGFDDNDYYAMVNAGLPKTQIYKCAGNSICVPVLMAIFKNILDGKFRKKISIEEWFT